jgi:Di-haem oxidoreductase, putative peroxidase
MGRLTIAGLIAAVTLGTFVVAASAQPTPPPPSQPRPNFWPPLDKTKKAPVAEWYSDIPWTQKLGTYRGNEIDEALVLPYEALGAGERKFCTDNKLSPEDCMIETGVNNILGVFRTDTPYVQTDPKITAAAYCKSQSCIEVRLQASMFWTRSAGCKSTSTPPCVVQPRPFGVLPLKWNTNYGAYYKGYVINDGGSYAPQMPWYMAHYCDSKLTVDPQDPVCYGDYFSPMNVGFNWLPMKNETDWPNSAPFSVFPFAPPQAPSNTCPSLHENVVQTTCQLVLAGFDLSPVPQSLDDSSSSYKPYKPYNKFLFDWFNVALTQFPNNFTNADFYRDFPWSATTQVTWATDPNSPTDLYYQAVLNPFLGQFTSVNTQPAVVNTDPPDPRDCLGEGTPLAPPNVFPDTCKNTGNMRAGHYLYPRQCTLADLAGTEIPKLRACGLNYELHSAGWLEEWPPYVCNTSMLPSCGAGPDYSWWQAIKAADMVANQYGRTSFLFAGVPGMQLPVSFGKIPGSVSGLSVYEQVHNASIFDVYLPIANEADLKNAYNGRNYGDPSDFYHTLLMTNHMESDPDEFAEGIRGKVLWHNEYRTRKMYASGNSKFGARTFAAAFDPQTAPAPFHNNTCDGCHLRNGSGIPITPTSADGGYKLDASLQAPRGFMTTAAYNPYPTKDYTFTGQILPMKLVFFDLSRVTSPNDDSVYSKPLAFSTIRAPSAVKTGDLYYNNMIMQFYGDSFHVAKSGNPNYPIYNFAWSYEAANSNRMVVNTPRVNSELAKTYQPLQVKLGQFQIDPGCQPAAKPPNTTKPWPTNCNQINNAAIHAAIDGGSGGPSVGSMLLNGKRLGNSSAIEAIPNAAILGFYQNQTAVLGATIAGEILWNAGSRDGVGGTVKKVCTTKSLRDCYIGRFGWLGDRVSLEDQVANAAFVEMNMTTSEGYKKLYPDGNVMFPIRYGFPNLSERDINRMAAYARWGGNPTRSEFMASLPDVIAGETIFGQLNCDTCHVISKINIDPDDTMLSNFFFASV